MSAGMQQLLSQLAAEQRKSATADGDIFDVTIVVDGVGKVVGEVQGADADIVSMRRFENDGTYADIPRHYAIDRVVAAYYTEGS